MSLQSKSMLAARHHIGTPSIGTGSGSEVEIVQHDEDRGTIAPSSFVYLAMGSVKFTFNLLLAYAFVTKS
ncbi:hypothetical protein BDN67DRAFT_1010707 [Paxillus ammoniavirescens]|nr:hypothetical protein BDN67DRAFT_1010707 [Paxillus ammoniavirescens]